MCGPRLDGSFADVGISFACALCMLRHVLEGSTKEILWTLPAFRLAIPPPPRPPVELNALEASRWTEGDESCGAGAAGA